MKKTPPIQVTAPSSRNSILFLVIVLCVVLAVSACAPPTARLTLPNPGYNVADNANRPANPIHVGRQISYRIRLRADFAITYNPGQEDLIAVLPLPPDTPTQKVIGWETNHKPIREVTSKYGYRFLEFNFGKNGQHTLSYDAEVDLRKVRYQIDPTQVGRLDEVPKGILDDYTIDGPFYHTGSETIFKALANARGDSRVLYDLVHRIWAATRHSLFYKGHSHKLPADEILRIGNGSCTEYSFVLISLCRAAGIPARFDAGSFSPPPGKKRGENRSGHKVVEVYLPKVGWWPIESTRSTGLPMEQQDEFFFGAKDTRLFSFIYEPEPNLINVDPRYNMVSWHSSGPGKMRVKWSVSSDWIKESL